MRVREGKRIFEFEIQVGANLDPPKCKVIVASEEKLVSTCDRPYHTYDSHPSHGEIVPALRYIASEVVVKQIGKTRFYGAYLLASSVLLRIQSKRHQ